MIILKFIKIHEAPHIRDKMTSCMNEPFPVMKHFGFWAEIVVLGGFGFGIYLPASFFPEPGDKFVVNAA